MLVRDGQHRASCLFVERGNVKVPVMRLYFDKDCDLSYVPSRFRQFWKKVGAVRPRSVVRFIGKGCRFVARKIRRIGKSLSRKAKSGKIARMEEVYFS